MFELAETLNAMASVTIRMTSLLFEFKSILVCFFLWS